METLVDRVAEQTGFSREEAIEYMDALESISVIARVAPGASWDEGAWVMRLDGTREAFAGPMADD